MIISINIYSWAQHCSFLDIKYKHVTEADHNESIDSITWMFIQNYAFKFESIFLVNRYNNYCETEQKVIEILMEITHNK